MLFSLVLSSCNQALSLRDEDFTFLSFPCTLCPCPSFSLTTSFLLPSNMFGGFPGGSDGKESACNA